MKVSSADMGESRAWKTLIMIANIYHTLVLWQELQVGFTSRDSDVLILAFL